MSPHPQRPGVGTTLIDIGIVLVILAVSGTVVWVACAAAASGVRAVSRLWRGRRRQ